MKSLEQLALELVDVTNLFPKILTDVEEAAREKRFARQLVIVNTDLTRRKGRTLTVPYRRRIPYRGAGAVGYVGEGATPPEVEATYTTREVTVTKIGAWFKVRQEVIDAVEIDVIRDQILEVGEAIADLEDWMIMDELFGTVTTETVSMPGAGANQTVSLTQNKLIRVVEARDVNAQGTVLTVTTIYCHSTQSGYITIAEAKDTGDIVWVKYVYCTRANIIDVAAAGTVSYPDLLSARTKMLQLKFTPDVAVLAYDQMGDLLMDERFIDTSRYGAREPILNGEIGRAAGWKLMSFMHTSPGAVLYIDRSRAAWLIIKRELTMKVKELPEEDSYAHYFYADLKPAVINEDAIVVQFLNAEVMNI